jgi:hypothetical protein
MAPEPAAGDAANNSADFDKVLDVYFNSTQCIMPTRLFGDGRQGQPGAVAGVYALSHASTHCPSSAIVRFRVRFGKRCSRPFTSADRCRAGSMARQARQIWDGYEEQGKGLFQAGEPGCRVW